MRINLEEVVKSNPKTIYYSVNTVWWTHDPKDLYPGGVPLDRYGSPLFQTDSVSEFLDPKKISECSFYGKFPIQTLMMCHAKNIHELELKGFDPRKHKYEDVAKIVEENIDEFRRKTI